MLISTSSQAPHWAAVPRVHSGPGARWRPPGHLTPTCQHCGLPQPLDLRAATAWCTLSRLPSCYHVYKLQALSCGARVQLPTKRCRWQPSWHRIFFITLWDWGGGTVLLPRSLGRPALACLPCCLPCCPGALLLPAGGHRLPLTCQRATTCPAARRPVTACSRQPLACCPAAACRPVTAFPGACVCTPPGPPPPPSRHRSQQ